MSKIVRSDEEIAQEIQNLKDVKVSVPKQNFFGDDNWAAIAAAIWVLENKADDNEVYNKWSGEENGEYELDAASEAVSWLEGEDDMVPSKLWRLGYT